jgi:hypothetical protein
MSIGSISSSAMATTADPTLGRGHTPAADKSIADHVASAGEHEHEPIRSGSETLGTLVDTYL